GGTESMSMVPMMGHKIAMNPAIFSDENIGIAYGMGITAEHVARKWKVSRQIITDSRNISADEGPRAGTTMEVLSKLKTVFRNGQFGGTVTAGNSSQMSDGAGAVLLASEKAIKEYNLQPQARFVGFSVAGVPPEVMGIGPK